MDQLNIKMYGAFTVVLKKANGEVEVVHKDNLIVDSGFDLIADAIFNPTRPGAAQYIAIGTSSTAAAAGQTALVAQLSTRAVATYAHTPGTKVATVEYTFLPGTHTGAIVEAGIFNASSGGTMFDRVVFPVVNKGADDTLTTTFTLTMS